MNKAIALKGRFNIGKTSTLKLFIDKFKTKFKPEKTEHLIDGQDVRVIYTVGGIKIGIETQGDPYSRLLRSLDLFKAEDCQIIVCACRSSGATVNAVKSLHPQYILSFRGQSEVSLKEWQTRSNSTMADMILQEVSEAINA